MIPVDLPEHSIQRVSSMLEGRVVLHVRLYVAQDSNGMNQIIKKIDLVAQQIKSQFDNPRILSVEERTAVIALGITELTRESVEKLILQDAQPIGVFGH